LLLAPSLNSLFPVEKEKQKISIVEGIIKAVISGKTQGGDDLIDPADHKSKQATSGNI